MIAVDHRSRCFFFIVLLFWLICGFDNPDRAANCEAIEFEHKPSAYYGPGQYFMTCPSNGAPVRCYHYHRHWVCEKEGLLYWDRRLESAALTACGCPLPPDTAPASPAISVPPKKNIFGTDD